MTDTELNGSKQKTQSRISLSQLRAVEALASTGQFSRAAQLLGISQPTVSTQVQAFEALSAVRIFARDGHSVRIARGAEGLIGKIRLALRSIDEVEREISDPGRVAEGQIAIGFSAHRLIMPVLSAYVDKFPQMEIATRGGPSLELIDAVQKGELDIAAVSQVQPNPRFANHLLKLCKIVIYGQKGHPLLARGRVSLRDLAGHNLILWNRSSGTRGVIDSLAARTGVALKTVMEVSTLDVAYAAAASGLGIAVDIEGEVLTDNDIDVMPLEDAEAVIGHYLIMKPESGHYAAIAAFLDIARSLSGETAGLPPR